MLKAITDPFLSILNRFAGFDHFLTRFSEFGGYQPRISIRGNGRFGGLSSEVIIVLVSALSLTGYLLASRYLYRQGFPLDDAWIHQTYARNLAQRGEWAFVPGQPSAGSTSPLWSALLAVGYTLNLGPYLWTYLCGWVALSVLGLLGMQAFRALCPKRARYALWAGLFLVLEWHLVWAAGSGMETLVFAGLVLWVLTQLARGSRSWLSLGMLIGVGVWVRPDGLTLLAPALLVLLIIERDWKCRLLAAARLALGVALLVLPYLVFNLALSGSWWPNTFFAKQAEYAIHRQVSLWQRYVDQASLLLVGAGVLLAPGFILVLLDGARRRAWGLLAGCAWLIGYLLIYALRLPVTYQHGRYIMPAMPVYFVWSLAGLACWIEMSSAQLWRRVLGRVWLVSVGLVLVIFWFRGAWAYAWDVAFIESEMVVTAQWVAENTEPGALVAAHDIGALGFYAKRPLLDLAGLVSPQVIPFIRDEQRLGTFLDAHQADYLVTFPGWYPQLAQRGQLIFSSQGTFSPAMGYENMAIYRWLKP
jgi:hypothetical protein